MYWGAGHAAISFHAWGPVGNRLIFASLLAGAGSVPVVQFPNAVAGATAARARSPAGLAHRNFGESSENPAGAGKKWRARWRARHGEGPAPACLALFN